MRKGPVMMKLRTESIQLQRQLGYLGREYWRERAVQGHQDESL